MSISVTGIERLEKCISYQPLHHQTQIQFSQGRAQMLRNNNDVPM